MRDIRVEKNWTWFVPLFIGVSLCLWRYAVPSYYPSMEIDKDVLSAGITVGAIFAGFDSIYRGAIFSIKGKLYEKIKNSGYFEIFLSYITSSVRASLIFVSVSLLMMLFYEQRTSCNPWFETLWIVFGLHMFCAFVRINIIFNHLTQQSR